MKIEIDSDDAIQVFLILEELVQLLHQPSNRTAEKLKVFAVEQKGYKRVADLYYNTVWEWLPDEIRQTIEER